jgi:glycosyltransferase involved in cell wall biosynthesis
MPTTPRFSIVLFTKNGMPYVREAVASLEAQTFEDYEVVIQDAASTDGTAEFLRERLPGADMRSEPDSGLGDAYNRAFPRCRGEIVGTLDADNLVPPNALDSVDAIFREHETAAAIYGAVEMIDAEGRPLRLFVPEPYDLYKVMRCELVPPMSTGYFDRRRCASELRGDGVSTTVQDYDLWLRLSGLEIVRVTTILGSTRVSDKSMSRNANNYEHFCAEKIAVLEAFVATRPELQPKRDAAVTGIYCWAAEAVLEVEGPGTRFDGFLARAAALDPKDVRLKEVRERASAPRSV